MSAVAECLHKAELGEPKSYRSLSLFPRHIAGGALLVQERLVHLCTFRLSARDSAEPSATGTRIARALQRRRSRQ